MLEIGKREPRLDARAVVEHELAAGAEARKPLGELGPVLEFRGRRRSGFALVPAERVDGGYGEDRRNDRAGEPGELRYATSTVSTFMEWPLASKCRQANSRTRADRAEARPS